MKFSVLMLSLDSTLLSENDIGNSQKRHILYGQYFRELHIITTSDEKKLPQHIAPNVTIYPITRKYLYPFLSYRLARKLCTENRIDIITSQDPVITGLPACILKYKFKLPLCIQIHAEYLNNPYWLRERPIINRLINFIAKYTLLCADTIRTGTDIERSNLIKRFKKNKVFCAPVIHDLTPFLSIERKPSGKPTLLFAGRLVKQKDIPTLLRSLVIVAKEVPTVECIIAGDGAESAYLHKLSKKLNIDVKFVGKVSYEELCRYLSVCDVFVLPSLYEGTARVLLEALAAGVPVVSTSTAGAMDLLGKVGVGKLVKPRDIKGLAEAILYYLRNPDAAKQTSITAKQYIKDNYSKEKLVDKFVQLWQQTVQKKYL